MTDREPIPISLVAHTVFCVRRAWLEAAGEEVASLAIEQGVADHRRIDQRSDERVQRRRSVNIAHDRLGILGRCDVIDVGAEGLEIVEFKSAPIRRKATVTRPQVIQLALQRLCLEEMGHRVTKQSVYFTTLRRAVQVDLTDADLAESIAYVERTREILDAASAPGSLVDDPRCATCSHVSVCLPDERTEGAVRRRISVSDPHGEVLHVVLPGARVSMRQGRLIVSKNGEEIRSLPLERVEALVLHGNVDVSSALVRDLMWHDRTVLWCSGRGWLMGYATSSYGPNGAARVKQHLAAAQGNLALAGELVGSKVSNQATQLRRNSRTDVSQGVARLRQLNRMATTSSARNVTALLGIEGEAASVYFEHFTSMISPTAVPDLVREWRGRHGRGSTDGLNVALNFVYGLLLGDMVRACVACGLDPHAGFLHSSGRNKPALALDLMEQFRPVVADSVILGAVNNGELTSKMFTTVLGDARLRDDGKRALVAAYERRASTESTHPVFGYRVSWRRALEVQARMVLGLLDGTQDRYVGIRVR